MNYDDWKLESPYKNEPENYEVKEYFFNGYLVEVYNDFAYCNNQKVRMNIINEHLDNIEFLKSNFIMDGKIYVNCFEMDIDIFEFYDTFYNIINNLI